MTERSYHLLGRLFRAELLGKLPCAFRGSDVKSAEAEGLVVKANTGKGRKPAAGLISTRGYLMTNKGWKAFCEEARRRNKI